MPPSDRSHWLDGTRATAIALVVLAHGLLPFLNTDIGWAVHEPSQFLIVDGAAWVIRAFVMPLFFLLSGLFAAKSMSRWGVGGLLRRRAERIAVPLVVLLVPVSMAMNSLWDWGKSLDPSRVVNAVAVPELRASEFAITLGHLWFLYYLVIITAVVAAGFVAARALGCIGRGRGVPLLPAAVAVAWLPLWSAQKLQLDTPLAFGIDLPIAVFHALFFVWGFLLRARETELAGYKKQLWLNLGLSGACFAGLLPALLGSVSEQAAPAWWAFVLSGGFSVAMVAVALGLCARLFRSSNRRVQLMSSASYWTYVLHLPLLVLLQVALYRAGLPPVLQFVIAIATTAGLCLVSYRYVVRDTQLRRFVG